MSNGRIVLHVLQLLQRAEVEITRKRQDRVHKEEETDESNGELEHHENVRKEIPGKAVIWVGAHQRKKEKI